MNWVAIGAPGKFGGAIAVVAVATLGYLGVPRERGPETFLSSLEPVDPGGTRPHAATGGKMDLVSMAVLDSLARTLRNRSHSFLHRPTNQDQLKRRPRQLVSVPGIDAGQPQHLDYVGCGFDGYRPAWTAQ